VDYQVPSARQPPAPLGAQVRSTAPPESLTIEKTWLRLPVFSCDTAEAA
jgi:hypothetical protein